MITTRIVTGSTYTNDETPRVFQVTAERQEGAATRMDYIDRDGFKGHILYENNIVYMPNVMAGHYYPTQFRVEAE
jgi:hypothetical protein